MGPGPWAVGPCGLGPTGREHRRQLLSELDGVRLCLKSSTRQTSWSVSHGNMGSVLLKTTFADILRQSRFSVSCKLTYNFLSALLEKHIS